MVEVMGWLGATCFSFCGLPQAIKTYQTKSASDFSWAFLLLWWFGEIFTFVYVFMTNLAKDDFQYPLLANYVLNFIIICYLFYAKVQYKGEANGC